MNSKELANVSKYMTIWFKKTPQGTGYGDFREVPSSYALQVADKIKSGTKHDREIDAEFGKGFSEYMRELLVPIEPLPKQASIDKFG